MDRVVAHVRRLGLASVALLSVGVGVGTIWVIARPDVIGGVPTWTLFGVVGLLVLPLAVIGALVMDRKAIAAATPARESVVAAYPVRVVDEPPPSNERAVTLSHVGAPAHDDRSARHRRHRSPLPVSDETSRPG